MTRAAALVATAALALSLLAPGSPQAATLTGATPVADPAQGEEPPFRPSICVRALGPLSSTTVDRSALDEDRLVIGSWLVRPRAWRWRGENRFHPTWNTILHSSAWLIPDDTRGLPGAIDAMLEQLRVNPDPGRSPDMGVRGWTEAHVTKRMTTALCLYEWADVDVRQRLVPVIEALARANMDPRRYAGPPRRGPHNHGLMADRVLLDAAHDLGRPGWAAYARQRIALQLRETFDACGMIHEQSSSYLMLHVRMWTGIARWLEEPDATIAREAVKGALRMADALTRPDGRMEFIGDGQEHVRPVKGAGPTRWCPQTGWFADTWRDSPLTEHAIVRFGPGMRGHGHADHGAATWWVGSGDDSVAVLTDRGMFGKTRNERFRYSRSAEAHSTLLGIVGPSKAMTATLRDAGRQVSLFGQGGTSAGKPGRWVRHLHFGDAGAVLTVSDRVEGGDPRRVRQRFTLDPVWSDAGRGTFRAPGGWRLTIQCGVGAPEVRDVPHFPDKGLVQRALSVDCAGLLGGTSPPMTAVLRVRPPSA